MVVAVGVGVGVVGVGVVVAVDVVVVVRGGTKRECPPPKLPRGRSGGGSGGELDGIIRSAHASAGYHAHAVISPGRKIICRIGVCAVGVCV